MPPTVGYRARAFQLIGVLAASLALGGCGSGGAASTTPPGSGGASTASGSGGQAVVSSSGGATGSGGAVVATGSGGSVVSSGGAGPDPAGSGGSGDTQGSGGATVTAGQNGQGASPGTGGMAAAGGRSGGGGASGGATGAGGTNHTGVWKVMMLGDSVTGSTCYPQLLSKTLIAGGHTNFQFIGTVTNNNGCSGAPSVKTEGHGGYGATYLPMTSTRPKCTKQPQGCGSYAELMTWAAEKPDIVLMHYATNDVWDGEPTMLILQAWQAILAEFRKNNPNVIFFISKIIPLIPAPQNAIALNAAVTPAWAAANATPTSPVYIIDHWTGFDASTDTMDGVHPNPVGAMKMATASYNALVAAGYF